MLNLQFYKLMDKLAIGCSHLPDRETQDKIVSVLAFLDEKIFMNSRINDNLVA